MADSSKNTNSSYIEQIKELRALRMQQLKNLSAEQRYYNTTILNQKALIAANKKLAESFDSMSRTFATSIKGLSGLLINTASKGVSITGNVVGNVANSITSGLTKVLPIAIAGILGKVLVWDSLTEDNKKRLKSSFSNLFLNVFSGLQEMLEKFADRLVKSFQDWDIKFPIFSTLTKKAEILFKLIGSGFEYAKLKFDDLMDFLGSIKDPSKILESGLKALTAGTLLRLLLPATASLVTSLLANAFLMKQIEGAIARGVSGTRGGGRGVAGPVAGAAAGVTGAAASRVVGKSVAENVAKRIGARLVAGSVLAAIPVFGELALAGYTVYELYQIAKELGFTDEEAKELAVTPAQKTSAIEYYGEISPTKTQTERYERSKKELSLKKEQLKSGSFTGTPEEIQSQMFSAEKSINSMEEKLKDYEERARKRNLQRIAEISKEGDPFVKGRIYKIWKSMKKADKIMAIENQWPILETENYVYFMNENQEIVKKEISEYIKEEYELEKPVKKVDKGDFVSGVGDVIKQFESAKNYDTPFLNPKTGKPFVSLDKPLTQMTGEEVLAYQRKQVEATKAAGYGIRNGKVIGTGAIGAYQINQENLLAYYNKEENKKEKSELFNQEQQDKIYRSLINNAVENFLATGDKEAFKTYVENTWTAFKTNKTAKTELNKFLINIDSLKKADNDVPLTKKERARQEKIIEQRSKELFKQLTEDADYRPVTISEQKAKEVKEAVENVKTWMDKITEPIQERAKRFFSDPNPDNLPTDKKSTSSLNINYTDNSTRIASASDSGGSNQPSVSYNQVVSRPYDKYSVFTSLAGGQPIT